MTRLEKKNHRCSAYLGIVLASQMQLVLEFEADKTRESGLGPASTAEQLRIRGVLAHSVERSVRNRQAGGSKPPYSTFPPLEVSGAPAVGWGFFAIKADFHGNPLAARQRVRVVKEIDSKSIGLCPRGFKSRRCRVFRVFFSLARRTNTTSVSSV